jgi:protein-L-isoaspartate(D-aspartate) O-methyltransferase
MLDVDLAGRGIRDERVLAAMTHVPREAFVLPEWRREAYEDMPLPIGEGQTISQPYIVARMAEALELKGDEHVLEIGTGSGYGAAILSRLADEVFSVERLERLAAMAEARLRELGYSNVYVRCGDGSVGWAENAPYQGIVVTAAARAVPSALLGQLAPGSRLVMPIGPAYDEQRLVRVRRTTEGRFLEEDLGPVQFVPLVVESRENALMP